MYLRDVNVRQPRFSPSCLELERRIGVGNLEVTPWIRCNFLYLEHLMRR